MAKRGSIPEIRQRSLTSAILWSIALSGLCVTAIILDSVSYGLHPAISYPLIFISIIYISVRLAQCASRFKIYGKTTHLPMELCPLLLMVGRGEIISLDSLVVWLLLLYAIQMIFSSYRTADSSGILSCAALSLGVIPLLYPPLIVLWGALLFALLILERNMREIFVVVVTLLVPLFAQIYIKWLMGGEFIDGWYHFASSLTSHSGFSIIGSLNALDIAALVLMFYLFVTSALSIGQLENTMKAKRRLVILVFISAAIPVGFLIPSADSSLLTFLALPLSLLIPVAFLRHSRLVSFIFYILLLLLSLASLLC